MRRWWRRQSIRTRLTAAYASVLVIILFLYATGLSLFVAHRLSADLDHGLRRDFEIVESILERDANGSVVLAGAAGHAHEHAEQIRAEIWDPSGELLIRTTAVGQWFGPAPSAAGLSTRRIDGERVRALVGPHSVSGRRVFIRVFRSEESLHTTIDTLVLIAILGLPVGAAIAAIGGHALARRSLAPVARMTERASIITADHLHDRLPIDNPYDELGRLAQVFNQTFARLQASFEQLRRFTADASHELRTPLTAIRAVGEVALVQPSNIDAYRDAIGSMLEEVDRLAHLLDGLLTLSRADAGRVLLERTEADLLEMTREIAKAMAPLADQKCQQVEVHGGVQNAWLDADVLRLAIVNLLDNAIKYGPPNSTISVTVDGTTDGVVLEVRDEGPGVPAAQRARVFERFYRVDKARSRASGGAGLGLSIAQWAVRAHGGEIDMVSDDARVGAVFRIRIPRRGKGDEHDFMGTTCRPSAGAD